VHEHEHDPHDDGRRHDQHHEDDGKDQDELCDADPHD